MPPRASAPAIKNPVSRKKQQRDDHEASNKQTEIGNKKNTLCRALVVFVSVFAWSWSTRTFASVLCFGFSLPAAVLSVFRARAGLPRANLPCFCAQKRGFLCVLSLPSYCVHVFLVPKT